MSDDAKLWIRFAMRRRVHRVRAVRAALRTSLLVSVSIFVRVEFVRLRHRNRIHRRQGSREVLLADHFPFIFHLRAVQNAKNAAKSSVFEVRLLASQASDVGSIAQKRPDFQFAAPRLMEFLTHLVALYWR
jgi:hypothetical protein